jgi:hypothetical protein
LSAALGAAERSLAMRDRGEDRALLELARERSRGLLERAITRELGTRIANRLGGAPVGREHEDASSGRHGVHLDLTLRREPWVVRPVAYHTRYHVSLIKLDQLCGSSTAATIHRAP